MDDKKWTVLSSEYLIKRPWLTARKDKVRLPNGNENPEYWVLEYPDWVNVIAVTDDGQMVIERQYRHALGRTDYEICAGVIEQGETPEEAGRRELMEEAGYGGGEWREIMVLSPNSSSCSNLCHCFVAEGVRRLGPSHQEKTEDIDIYLKGREEVRQMLLRGDFVQALMVAPLWKYFSGLGR